MPEGFDDITTEENSPIDVYYHDEYLGSHIATFDDDYFYFDEPKLVLKELEFIQKKDIVLKEISKKLKPNIELACDELDKSKCTYIEPDVIAIILDRAKYRVYLYINYSYLKLARLPTLEYLQCSKAPLGISAKRGIFSKSIYDQDAQNTITTFNLNSTETISKGNLETSVESIVSFGFNQKMESQELPIYKMNSYIGKYRAKKSQLSFGTANTYGSFLIPSQNLLGVILETDKTLIKNPDITYGTPIQVNVSDPSVVEVKRGNSIIYSKFFAPGNYFIDTKSFPSGVYNIQINVSSLYGTTKTTNRVFIKKDDYPALGEDVYSIGLGFLPALLAMESEQRRPVVSG